MNQLRILMGVFAASISFVAVAGETFHFEDITPQVDPIVRYPTYLWMTPVHASGIFALSATLGPARFQFVHSDEKGFQRRPALSGRIVDFTPKGSMALNGTAYYYPTGGAFYDGGQGWTFNAVTGETTIYHVFKSDLVTEYPEVRPLALDDLGNVLVDCSQISYGDMLEYAQLAYLRNGRIYFLPANTNISFHQGRLIGNGVAFVQNDYAWGFFSPEAGWKPLARPVGALSYPAQMDVNQRGIAVYPGSNQPTNAKLDEVRLADDSTVTSIPDLKALQPGGYWTACLNELNQIAAAYAVTENGVKRFGWAFYDGKNAYDLSAKVAAQVPAGWTFDTIFDLDDAGRVYGRMITPEGFQALVRIDVVTSRTRNSSGKSK